MGTHSMCMACDSSLSFSWFSLQGGITDEVNCCYARHNRYAFSLMGQESAQEYRTQGFLLTLLSQPIPQVHYFLLQHCVMVVT